jgi:hypothetical protein
MEFYPGHKPGFFFALTIVLLFSCYGKEDYHYDRWLVQLW